MNVTNINYGRIHSARFVGLLYFLKKVYDSLSCSAFCNICRSLDCAIHTCMLSNVDNYCFNMMESNICNIGFIRSVSVVVVDGDGSGGGDQSANQQYIYDDGGV